MGSVGGELSFKRYLAQYFLGVSVSVNYGKRAIQNDPPKIPEKLPRLEPKEEITENTPKFEAK